MIDDFKGPAKSRVPEPLRLDTLKALEPAKIPDTDRAQKHSTGPQDDGFKTPEQIAEETESVNAAAMSAPQATNPDESGQKKRFALPPWKSLSKRQQIGTVVVAVLVLAGVGGGTYALTKGNPAPAKAPTVAKVIKKTTPVIPVALVSSLTGMPVTSDQQKLPVTGVMVENSPDARPQSGLKDAGVVFEAIAEGGITRFLALYQEEMPGNIGPIRSSRPYYLQWALGFDAAYAHVGGSPDALADIKSWGVRDLDQFSNSGSYHRISTRYAPHNVYTSRADLLSLQNSKGYSKSTFTGFVRKKEAPAQTPTTSSVDLAISGYYYNVHYDYDATANAYKRTEGGVPHMDADSNTQLEPKVVVALVLPYALLPDGYHSDYQTIGTGKMYIFQDGVLTTGTWQKTDMKTNFTFTDDAGKPLALNPGQTWITAVGSATNVTYK